MVYVHEIHERMPTQGPGAPGSMALEDSDFTDASDDEYISNHNAEESPLGFGEDGGDHHSISSIDNESVLDRVKALKYMIPYNVRVYLFSIFIRSKSMVVNFYHFSKKFAWVSITSIFILGFPLYYEYQREQQLKFSDLNMSFSPAASST